MASLAVVLQGPKPKNGRTIFESFKEANRKNFWNRELVSSMESIIYMGFLRPSTLFISGPENCVQTIKSEYARRILKPPSGYKILSLGSLGAIQEVEQMNFVPLGDIICDAISQLNSLGQTASLCTIKEFILEHCPYMAAGNMHTLKQTLQSLTNTGLVYRIGEHFFVSIPTQSPPAVASHKIQTTVECQTGMSIMEEEKKEKKGLLARLFARRAPQSGSVNTVPSPPPPPAPMTAAPVVPMVFTASNELPDWMGTIRASKNTHANNANRYYTFDRDDAVVAPKQRRSNGTRRRRRHQHSAQLSSSSECLNYGPIDPPECLPGNVEVVDDLVRRRRRRATAERKQIARTSTPVPAGSDSAYSPSPVTDSNEEPEPASWSEHDDHNLKQDHTYVNLHQDESTQFEDISQAHIVPQAHIHISNV